MPVIKTLFDEINTFALYKQSSMLLTLVSCYRFALISLSRSATPCDELNVPVNGAKICNGWRTDYGLYCMMACMQNYTLTPDYSFLTWRVCGASGTWIPTISFPDCLCKLNE